MALARLEQVHPAKLAIAGIACLALGVVAAFLLAYGHWLLLGPIAFVIAGLALLQASLVSFARRRVIARRGGR